MKKLFMLLIAITFILFVFIGKAAEDTGFRVYVTVDGDSEITTARIDDLIEEKIGAIKDVDAVMVADMANYRRFRASQKDPNLGLLEFDVIMGLMAEEIFRNRDYFRLDIVADTSEESNMVAIAYRFYKVCTDADLSTRLPEISGSDFKELEASLTEEQQELLFSATRILVGLENEKLGAVLTSTPRLAKSCEDIAVKFDVELLEKVRAKR